MNDYKLRKIIKETMTSVLVEVDSPDLVPQDGILRNSFMNQWRMLYNLLPNIKKSMDATYNDNNGRITKKNVNDIVEYIKMSIDNILKT